MGRDAVRRIGLALGLWAALGGAAQAGPFVVRTAGSDTIIAVDQASLSVAGAFRSGWTYEFFRRALPWGGQRAQIMGILELVNCRKGLVRHLKVTHYLATGVVIHDRGPEKAWLEPLRGSNTDLMLRAMCEGPGDAWAHRQAGNVFDLYARAWP